MSSSDELYFTKEHEWIRFEDDHHAVIGITDYAIEQLGDLVYLELPDEGSEFERNDSFGTVESTKTVSDLYAPLTGKVVAVNTSLSDSLEDLTSDPYQKGWLIKLNFKSKDGALLSKEQYNKFIHEDD